MDYAFLMLVRLILRLRVRQNVLINIVQLFFYPDLCIPSLQHPIKLYNRYKPDDLYYIFNFWQFTTNIKDCRKRPIFLLKITNPKCLFPHPPYIFKRNLASFGINFFGGKLGYLFVNIWSHWSLLQCTFVDH